MITILTSLYNANNFIDTYLENITSCLSYTKCEHLIYNVKSSNNKYVIDTLDIYRLKFNNIKVIELEEDIGLYNIWNDGIKKSKFELLTTSNIDDYITKDFLIIHYLYLKNNPNINLVCSIPKISYNIIKNNKENLNEKWFNQKKIYSKKEDINYIYENGKDNPNKFNIYTGIVKKNLYHEKYPSDIKKYLNLKKNFLYLNKDELEEIWVTYDYFDIYDMIIINKDKNIEPNNIPHASPVWRKKLNNKYGYFNEKKYSKYADYEFWLRCLSNNEKFGIINKNLYIYYYNTNSHNRRNNTINNELIKNKIISIYF